MNIINTPAGLVSSRTEFDPPSTSLAERYRQAMASSSLRAADESEEAEETEEPTGTEFDDCPEEEVEAEEVDTVGGKEEQDEDEEVEIPCFMKVLTRQWGKQMFLETLMYGEEEENGIPPLSIDI